jgi:hypothetical protein
MQNNWQLFYKIKPFVKKNIDIKGKFSQRSFSKNSIWEVDKNCFAHFWSLYFDGSEIGITFFWMKEWTFLVRVSLNYKCENFNNIYLFYDELKTLQ